MRRWTLLAGLLLALGLAASAGAEDAKEPCPPTPGIPPINDVARGRCLFNSLRAFGQDPSGPFASCAICHYGHEKTDRGMHLVQITNVAGETVQVLRKTLSLLKAAVNFPYGWDGRFQTIQDAARAAILSPTEMNGRSVTEEQLDALAALVLSLAHPDPEPTPSPPPPAPSPQTLALIALGKEVFFGKGTCTTCHPAPNFTINAIATNQVSANFSGNTDRGAGFVGTGADGHFKVPSLLFFGAGEPFMHAGVLARLPQLLRFYNKSLGLNLTGRELTGLEYWLRNCLDPRKSPRPSTC